MALAPDIVTTVTAIVDWLDDEQAAALLKYVERQDGSGVRQLVQDAGMQLPPTFDFGDPTWNGRLTEALRERVAEEEVDEDAATTLMPDYASFAADLRDAIDED